VSAHLGHACTGAAFVLTTGITGDTSAGGVGVEGRQMNTVTLDPRDGARVARGIVASCCGRADTGQFCADAAILMTSELVTNALQHGCGSVSFGVEADDLRVRVEVGDEEPQRPSLIAASPGAESGRGLFIVNALATTWGVDEQPAGKIVWFELPCQP